MKLLPVATASLALTSAAWGKDPTPVDKAGYTLFNPTPRESMRDLSTDRPDQTESPYTVDAGHWQIEFDLANYTLDREDGVRTEIWNIAPLNMKVGMSNDIDLQMLFDSYSEERVRTGHTTTTTRDWGDLTLRLKVNLWGNDGGDTAFGLMPFVKIPLKLDDAGNDLVEGGLIVPLTVSLPGGWGMGLMTEVDFVADETGGGRHAAWINSITFSHALTSKLSGYAEFFSLHSAESGADWVAQVDVGLTCAVSGDLQLDAGCNFGVTDAAPDLQPFVGMSIRF